MRLKLLKALPAISLFLFGLCVAVYPSLVRAVPGPYYTLPVSDTVNSYFDHASPTYTYDTIMKKYNGFTYTASAASLADCSDFFSGAGCYDGHNGIDYNSAISTDVHAAASGSVDFVGWDDPNDPEDGFGFYVRLWHSSSGQSTLYGHMASTSLALSGQTVARGAHIGETSNTGFGGYHLHFSVFDDDSNTSAHSIDPYGWRPVTSDLWSINQGLLWTSASPSLHIIDYLPANAPVTVQTIGRESSGHSRAGLMWKSTVNEIVCSVDYIISKTGSPTDAIKLRVWIENSGQTSTNPENNTTLIVSDTGTSITTPLIPAASISADSNNHESHRRTFPFSSCLTVPADRKVWFDMARTVGASNTNYYNYKFILNGKNTDRIDTQRFRRQATDATWTLEADGGSEMLFRAEGL